MLIVADTSPINYLVLVQAEHVLPELYQSIMIPPVVLDELQSDDGFRTVREWARNPPSWLIVRQPKNVDASLRLDPGELAAISLAREVHADGLLIDERDGRIVAQSLGLQVAGTLAVLRDAALAELLVLSEAFDRLKQTTFRASPSLYQQLLHDYERRKSEK